MKKGLEKITNGAMNIATNVALSAGALEGIQYLSEAGASGYTTGLAGAATLAGLYTANKTGLVGKAAEGISSGIKSIKNNWVKAGTIALVAGGITAAGALGYHTGKNVAKDFSSSDGEVPELVINDKDAGEDTSISGELAARGTKKGNFQRTYRWDELFDNAEAKYGIEKGVLAGLCMREGYGNPLQLNSSGDGGAGMIQMQPGMAQHYGLKTHGSSTSLGADKAHGKELKKLLGELSYNYEEAMKYDDRFNPKKNVDAAARMLDDYHEIYNDWDKAISAYNVGQKKSNKVPVNTRHVNAVRENQEYYNEHDTINHAKR